MKDLGKSKEQLVEEIGVLRQKIEEIEDTFSKRERQFVESQSAAKLGNWDLDLVSQELEWSFETYKLFDKKPESFTPTFNEFASRVHPDDLGGMQTRFNKALESDKNPYHVQVRIINDTGREWVMEAFGKVERKRGQVRF